MGDSENRGMGVFIDGDDSFGLGHTGPVLNLSGDAAGDIEIGTYGNAGLTDLVILVENTGIDYRPGTA